MSTVSISAMNDFDECEARFSFSRQWRMKDGVIPVAMKTGIEVHEILSGKRLPEAASSTAQILARKLKAEEISRGYHITYREVEQVFQIKPKTYLKRIIDGVGTDHDGVPIVLDYKTTGAAWKLYYSNHYKRYISPKSLGWQSVGYLLPPPENLTIEMGFSVWPDTMIYLVIIAKTYKTEEIVIWRDKEREADFFRLIGKIEDAVDEEKYIKTHSWRCDGCTFRQLCLQEDGWEDRYERREDHDNN